MGIQNDIVLCYGIEFSYNDIIHLRKLDTDSMLDLWDEMGHIYCSDYYDQKEEYYTYIKGKNLDSDMTLNEFINNINENEMKINLKKVCNDYNLQYSEPKILCRPNIY